MQATHTSTSPMDFHTQLLHDWIKYYPQCKDIRIYGGRKRTKKEEDGEKKEVGVDKHVSHTKSLNRPKSIESRFWEANIPQNSSCHY